MERIKKTLWPKDSMTVTPEYLLRFAFGVPTRLIKSLFPLLGKEKVLELLRKTATENEKAISESPYYDGIRCESLKDLMEQSQGIYSPVLTEPVNWRTELVQKTTVMDLGSVKVTDRQAQFHTVKCLWADLFKEMDAADIGRAWVCESDFQRAKSWNPKLTLTRTQTIMEGAPYCDFCLTWKEEEDA